jgi:hypothetical protein
LIAYVFWHRRRKDVDEAEYEALLRDFHRVLADAAPEGFRASACFRRADEYEDWYLLDGSEALDPLEQAAVSGACRAPHDAAAAASIEGSGGLYRLREGPPVPGGRWLATAPESLPAGATLWRRRLALGPKPEFCLQDGTVTGRRVWP